MRRRTSRNQPPPSRRPPTPTCCATGKAFRILRSGESRAPTHPGYPPTKNADVVVLESLIYILPDQASPDYGSARCRIVCHLGELSGVDMNSLCRREPGIRSVTATHHLGCQRVVSDNQPRHRITGKRRSLTANGVFVVSITLSWLSKGVMRLSEGDEGCWMTLSEMNARFCPRLLGCRVPPRMQDFLGWML